jgi:hypothetical protein
MLPKTQPPSYAGHRHSSGLGRGPRPQLLVITMLLGFSSGILAGFLFQQHRQVWGRDWEAACGGGACRLGARRRAQRRAGAARALALLAGAALGLTLFCCCCAARALSQIGAGVGRGGEVGGGPGVRGSLGGGRRAAAAVSTRDRAPRSCRRPAPPSWERRLAPRFSAAAAGALASMQQQGFVGTAAPAAKVRRRVGRSGCGPPQAARLLAAFVQSAGKKF